jgi:hypothetical protein
MKNWLISVTRPDAISPALYKMRSNKRPTISYLIGLGVDINTKRSDLIEIEEISNLVYGILSHVRWLRK